MSEPLSDERLAEIRGLRRPSSAAPHRPNAEFATPGTAAYLGAAQSAIADLLAEVVRLRAALQEAEEARDGLTARVEKELAALERWAGEQNAGNAFAGQVRMWSLSHRDRLASWIATPPASPEDRP